MNAWNIPRIEYKDNKILFDKMEEFLTLIAILWQLHLVNDSW